MHVVGRRWVWIGILVCIVIIVAGVLLWWRSGDHNMSHTTTEKPALDTSWVRTLPTADKSGIDMSHVASGLLPPTNKWFSGAVLQATPQPVFAMPNSYLPTTSGLEIGSPRPTATDKTIAAPHVPAVTVSIAGSTSYRLTRYDVLSVELTYYDASQSPLARVTLVEGSPYVYIVAQRQVELDLRGGALQANATYAQYETPNGAFGVVRDGSSLSSAHTRLDKAQGMTLFSYASDAEATWLAQYASHRVTGTHVSSQESNGRSITTFSLQTHDAQPTVLGYMPHLTPEQALSSYSRMTLYGPQRYASGVSFRSSVPTPQVVDSLDLSRLSAADKQELVAALQADTAKLQASPADSYYGGKAVYRKAQLLDLARQLNQMAIQKKLQDSLTTDLSTWFAAHGSGERSFYYDSRAHGIVGDLPSFGSDQFNDHHFHYGYFIYAASVLAKSDKDFASEYRSAVESLIADIALPEASDEFPQQRVFDAYMGHSWASGSAPFADGNNQESTSEALNAWTGVALWGRVSQNTPLEAYGTWLLANEAAATRAYWTGIDTSQDLYKGFGHTLTSLNWGGKRDYATFFSADPGAMLAIQLLPLNPSMANTLPDRSHIARQLDEASSATLFRDYLAMYQALVDKKQALATARSLPTDKIDDGNSRTYMLAWIMAR